MTVEFRPLPFLERDIEVQERLDGTLIVRSRFPLKPLEPHIPHLLHRNARMRPLHPWMAQRNRATDAWEKLNYGQGLAQVNAVTQYLLDLRCEGQTVMVLSGNSIEHGVMQVAAMQARMPYSAITTAYSLLSQDHAKLKAMATLLEPAVIFVQDANLYGPALATLRHICPTALVIAVENADALLGQVSWQEVLQAVPGVAVQASIDRINHNTIAKYQFTSGSTGVPKAAIMTQGMLCAAMAMTSQMFQWNGQAPETVLLDWLPWSHVAGGIAVFSGILEDGGTLYIDNGRPTPKEFAESIRNLKEISPVRFSGMPTAYAMLAEALEKDEDLARNFFKDLRRMTYSGARIPENVHDALQVQAIKHLGFKIPFVSAYGSTETSAAVTYVHWPTDKSGLIGLPHPGVDLKLIPMEDGQRYEIRVKSPAVTPGYLKNKDLTQSSFDDEGFFIMGDCARFVDPANINEGFYFAGRVAEEFKLQTGIFVRVTSLRIAALEATAPLVKDIVITGADMSYVGGLIWLNESVCKNALNKDNIDCEEIESSSEIQNRIREGLRCHNAKNSGSSMQIKKVLILRVPPSMDAGETTDKGYINQRRLLETRADAVKALYENDQSKFTIIEI